MKFRNFLFFLVTIGVAVTAYAVTFPIPFSWNPSNPSIQTFATNAVNGDPAVNAFVALPSTTIGRVDTMKYNAPWFQLYQLKRKVSSIKYEPSGPAINANCAWPPCSPIILDMEGDGFRLGNAGEVVPFDINADGAPDILQWVMEGEDEAFLVLDRNKNDSIDSGAELFGNHTPIIGQVEPAEHGFIALAQYDAVENGGDGDGMITNKDRIWASLQLWLDENADGQTDEGELSLLSDSKVVSLGLDPVETKRRDRAGNWMRFWDWAECKEVDRQSKSGRCRIRMVDVFFTV